jgi:hypothetical protein
MSSRTCPDWPRLMEVAPDLRFKHYTLAEAQLPAEAIVSIEGIGRDDVAICCDLTSHVFNPEHTDPQIARALRSTHWFDLREWRPGVAGTSA